MSEEVLKVEHIGKKYKLLCNQEKNDTFASVLLNSVKGAFSKKNQVSKGEDFWALKDISFTVNKGEKVGIIGHNGAGKSTLLKLFSRITLPTEGEIKVKGRISSLLEVGTGFNQELTGRENIYLNGSILGMKKAEIDAKFKEIVEFSEIGEFLDTPVKRYSSGMYVKLAFAVAANLDPDILIVDEVLAVGDMKFQEKCLGKMDEISGGGRTVLFVSHNMRTIQQLCDRVIVLDHGRIIYDGNVDDGIKIYMDNVKKMELFNDLRTIKRASYYNEYISLVSLEILDKEECIFNYSENIKFKLNWIANKDVFNVKIRLGIYYADSTAVGVSFGKFELSGVKGKEYENIMEITTNGLAPGKYSAFIVMYQVNSFGTEQNIDGVNAFSFEIKEKDIDEIKWQHKYWGSVRFNDIKLIDNNKENSKKIVRKLTEKNFLDNKKY